MKHLAGLAAALYGKPWAMHPPALRAFDAWLRAAMRGQVHQQAQAQQAGPLRQAQQAGGGVAVIPLVGIMVQRYFPHMEEWGLFSSDKSRRYFQAAMAEPQVKTIVLDVDSPGGDVSGTEEFAAEVHAARGQKKVLAVANSTMGSALYYVGSQASEMVVTPSGMVGSIGVWGLHMDYSRAFDQAGITPTLISSGKYKVEANPWEPLGEEALAAQQAVMDHYYGLFVAAVARGRGVKPAAVRGGMGQGRMVTAQEAVKLGMADRVASLDQVLARLGFDPRGAAPLREQAADLGLEAQADPPNFGAPNGESQPPDPDQPDLASDQQAMAENLAMVQRMRQRLNRLALEG